MISRRTIHHLILASIAAGMAWFLWFTGIIRPLDRSVSDLILRAPRPTTAIEAPFVAVVIDDASVSEEGPVPWARSRMAHLIENIVGRGARAVVVDVILSEPGSPAGDDQLARALGPVPSILAAVVLPQGRWLLPLDQFGGAGDAAHAHAEIGSDGVVRQISATKQAAGISLPALSIAAARLAGWRGAITPGLSIHPDFRPGLQSIPTVSANSVLESDTPSGSFAGAVVFVGYTAAGAGDQFVIPNAHRGRPTPGVLVHAAAAAAVFSGQLLREASGWLIFSLGFVAAAWFQLLRSRSGHLSLSGLAIIVGAILAVTLVALWWSDLVLPPMTLMAAVLFSAAGREAVESFEAQRESDAVLHSLMDQQPSDTRIPPGVGGRLQLARALQKRIAHDGELRKTLLDGLREGVVLWDEEGQPVLANRSTERLWGRVPAVGDVPAPKHGARHRSDDTTLEIEQNGRHLEVEMRPIDSGLLGLFRDVTAARELERSRRDMQRMVSHELKTPLSSISGFGAMIETYDLSREERLRVAGLIRGEADRLADMVRTFLDLERLGSQDDKEQWTTVDLGSLAKERCDVLKAAAAESGQELHIEGWDDCPVTGSPALLARLIDNLVGNAIKYSPSGATIQVVTRRLGPSATLVVTDDGPGIDPEALPHIFERFYRVPGSGSSGSGLGLALVKEIADRHGARVRVTSEVGRGSTFTAEFPCVDREEEG